MNNYEIEAFMFNDSQSSTQFIGCFAADKIPRLKLKSNQSLIINLCNSSVDFSCHWISVFRSKKHLIYFDPGGISSYYLNKNIYKFLKQQKIKIVCNRSKIQSNLSQNCGKYCIVFLCLSHRGYSLNDINNLFYPESLNYLNDYVVESICKNILTKNVYNRMKYE